MALMLGGRARSTVVAVVEPGGDERGVLELAAADAARMDGRLHVLDTSEYLSACAAAFPHCVAFPVAFAPQSSRWITGLVEDVADRAGVPATVEPVDTAPLRHVLRLAETVTAAEVVVAGRAARGAAGWVRSVLSGDLAWSLQRRHRLWELVAVRNGSVWRDRATLGVLPR